MTDNIKTPTQLTIERLAAEVVQRRTAERLTAEGIPAERHPDILARLAEKCDPAALESDDELHQAMLGEVRRDAPYLFQQPAKPTTKAPVRHRSTMTAEDKVQYIAQHGLAAFQKLPK